MNNSKIGATYHKTIELKIKHSQKKSIFGGIKTTKTQQVEHMIQKFASCI